MREALICLLLLTAAFGQNPSLPPALNITQSPQPTNTPNAEISSHEEISTFKVKVNVVLVRVVVRDSQGRTVGNLKKEDFQLFDNRREQVITNFVLEQPGTQVAEAEKTSDSKSSGGAKLPERFIAFLFDDIHLNASDMMRVRQAADHHLASPERTDRAGIFTTSGQGVLDFTDDHSLLHDALLRLQPRPIAGSGFKDCPDVTYYMADLIQNRRDTQALQAATLDALDCAYDNDKTMMVPAQAMAQGAAASALIKGNHETQVALATLKDVVRKMSAMPGQRTVILVSPGFINAEEKQEENDLIQRALRSNIIVSALDGRGLYADSGLGDISQKGAPIAPAPYEIQYRIAGASADEDIMAELAEGTGGTFFHNNNDLEEGLRKLASAPEYYYLLGFSPQNLKLDGRYHSLKVNLKMPGKLSIQARRGYYAPKHIPDSAEQARQEIEEALFSQEEMHDLPVELHTQFFKATESDAKLAVLAHLDVRRLHFNKVEGRNHNVVTVVSGLFDRNGQFIGANQKIITMRLRDETLEQKLQSGLTMKTSFDVKPGSYLVRLVVRDTEGEISAENGAIEIP